MFIVLKNLKIIQLQKELHNRVYEKICKLIQFPLNKKKVEFHEVRMVSPTKPMFCVSFELPEEVAFKTN